MENVIYLFLIDDYSDISSNVEVIKWLFLKNPKIQFIAQPIRNSFYGLRLDDGANEWIDKYNDIIFHRFFRIKKESFENLLNILMRNDIHNLIQKKYRGGNYPVQPDKSLLIFLWYMAGQDTLQGIGNQFKVTASTVLQLVNVFLYLIVSIKNKYIFWPTTDEEYTYTINGFKKYPGTLGSIDGCHVNLKVPSAQHDSYVDRFMGHSINLLGICTAQKIFTYIFVGFPGSAHDSRVFVNSTFYRNIERYGPCFYFQDPDHHIIGDSAFPIRTWLMTPYRKNQNLGPMEKHHNYYLSSDRVAIENCFGLVKGRWRRLQFINTYSVAKAVEIATAACVLHNYCYLNNDQWIYIHRAEKEPYVVPFEPNPQLARLGQEKRNEIATILFQNR